MKIDTDNAPGALTLHGRFDAHEVPDFRARINDLLPSLGSELHLDLSDVLFIDSTALAELLSTQRQLQGRNAALVLRDPSNPVRVILELTAMERVFPTVLTGSAGRG